MVNENKLSDIIEEFDKKLLKLEDSIVDKLEKKINCKKCKEEINPFSWEYFRKRLFTKKYLVDSLWKSATKILIISILTIFFFDRLNRVTDFIRTKITWNDPGRRFPKIGKPIKEIEEEIKKFFNN